MARKYIHVATNSIYHVVSRGNGQQDIFFKTSDYFRFIRNLYEFNDEDVIDVRYRQMLQIPKLSGSDPDSFGGRVRKERKKRKLLIEILAFCLMPNHFHLVLRQLKDGGISEFIKRIKGGYAAYINKKYQRSGSLFQSHFKAVLIKSDFQLNTIFAYVHTNPCQLEEPRWKSAGLGNYKRAKEILETYKWSSFPDYIGKINFPSLTNRTLFTELYGSTQGCKNAVLDWVKHKSNSYEDIKDLVLE